MLLRVQFVLPTRSPSAACRDPDVAENARRSSQLRSGKLPLRLLAAPLGSAPSSRPGVGFQRWVGFKTNLFNVDSRMQEADEQTEGKDVWADGELEWARARLLYSLNVLFKPVRLFHESRSSLIFIINMLHDSLKKTKTWTVVISSSYFMVLKDCHMKIIDANTFQFTILIGFMGASAKNTNCNTLFLQNVGLEINVKQLDWLCSVCFNVM